MSDPELVEFILARVSEDEAEAALAGTLGRWNAARILAECDAKRRIVAFYLGSLDARRRQTDPLRHMLSEAINESHADTLKPLALPYADHPDHRAEWRP